MTKKTLGYAFKSTRKTAGLTLRQMADSLKIDFTYLSKIEANKANSVSDELLRRFASKYGEDIDKLFFLSNKIPDWMKERILKQPSDFKNICLHSVDEVKHFLTNNAENI